MKLSTAIKLLENLSKKKVMLVEYISTTPIDKAIDSLEHSLIHSPNSEIKEFVWPDENNYMSDPGIKVALIKENFGKLDVILKKGELLGWFPSSYSLNNNEYYKFNIDEVKGIVQKSFYEFIIILFERNYDERIKTQFLYHATPIERWVKIKKLGLSVRSQSKKGYHPDRVYFATSLESAETISEMLFDTEKNKDSLTGQYVIMKIEVQSLPKEIKFYKDPNFKSGVYTYSNIPPQYLEFVEKY